jgi:hypothetical protein
VGFTACPSGHLSSPLFLVGFTACPSRHLSSPLFLVGFVLLDFVF